jgi:hypothetical protein
MQRWNNFQFFCILNNGLHPHFPNTLHSFFPLHTSSVQSPHYDCQPIELHDCLHGCRANHGTGTAVIEAKMAQQLSYLELKPFYGVFLDLKKAFDLMDRNRCIMILEGYTAGPRMIRLIRTYWRDAIMVCRASGNYGTPFKAGHGVTQGGPLSAKLFNILVDAVAREWLRELREGGGYKATIRGM